MHTKIVCSRALLGAIDGNTSVSTNSSIVLKGSVSRGKINIAFKFPLYTLLVIKLISSQTAKSSLPPDFSLGQTNAEIMLK